jgi:hypothetical protein
MTGESATEARPTAATQRNAKRAEQPQYLRIFLRTPLAWALLFVMAGAVATEAYYREGNRLACASVSMLLDRQTFREVVAGQGRAEIRILNECLEYSTPDTYDTSKIPPLSAVRRLMDGLP